MSNGAPGKGRAVPARAQPKPVPVAARVRSQPRGAQATATAPSPVASEAPVLPRGAWRWIPVVIAVAALAWLLAIGLLVTAGSALEGRVSSPRLLFAVVWAIAALLTFAPVEFRLGLPGLTWQGIIGWVLLGYILAFVPPPTGWLLELPDLPVYLLFFVACFYAVSSAALPFTYWLGQRVFARRMHQLDLRRARRQGRELGILAVALMVLAALRVLMPLTGLLVAAVIVLVETLMLSQVTPEG
jgi:hypothetical protein